VVVGSEFRNIIVSNDQQAEITKKLQFR